MQRPLVTFPLGFYIIYVPEIWVSEHRRPHTVLGSSQATRKEPTDVTERRRAGILPEMGACLYIVHLLLPKTIQHFYDNTRSYGNEY